MSQNPYLLLSIAATLKETDEIIDMLQQSLADYKTSGDIKPVLKDCMLLLHKQTIDKAYEGDIIKTVEALYKMDKAIGFSKTSEVNHE